MKEKVLVTGAEGFAGQHLVRKLLDKGYSVTGIFHDETLLHFFSRDEIVIHKADIQRKSELAGAMIGIDTVYHLAAIPRNDLSKTWDQFYAVNVQGTLNLLEEAKSAGVRRFVFISTVEAAGYGNGTEPRKEIDQPNPENNYGKSKLEAERIVLNRSWPMECVVLRLPMIYGPGTFLIVPKLFGMVKKGFYPLIGNGETKMEFCYVGNAVEALILAGTRKEASGELFYISDNRSYTIKEVISQIASAMDSSVKFIHIPVSLAYLIGVAFEVIAKLLPFPPIVSKFSRKPFFTRETVRWTTRDVNIVSTEKIKQLLNYEPRVTIQEGCHKTAQWLKAQGI